MVRSHGTDQTRQSETRLERTVTPDLYHVALLRPRLSSFLLLASDSLSDLRYVCLQMPSEGRGRINSQERHRQDISLRSPSTDRRPRETLSTRRGP